MSLGSSMDLNITHLDACPNRRPFSDWPGLWLEGSHGGVGKLDWRWGASGKGGEEGEAVLMAKETWSPGVSPIHSGLSSPLLEQGSFSCGGFLMLGGSVWHGPHLTVWDSWSWEHACRRHEMGWGELAGSVSSSFPWCRCPKRQTLGVCTLLLLTFSDTQAVKEMWSPELAQPSQHLRQPGHI